MARTAAVVLCGGSGSRADQEVNKVYVELAGTPIVVRAIRPLLDHPFVDEVVVVAAETEIALCEATLARAGMRSPRVIAGGATRHESEASALSHLGPQIQSGEIAIVIVHDGARPLYDGEHLDDLIHAARAEGGAILGLPLEDDLVVIDEGRAAGARSRRGLWRSLTPQAFRADLLVRAFRAAARTGFRGTDTASTVEACGGAVGIVRGRARNIKVTFPEDLSLAEVLASGGDSDPGG